MTELQTMLDNLVNGREQTQTIPALIGCVEQLARQVEQLHAQQQQQAELLQQWADYMTQYFDEQLR